MTHKNPEHIGCKWTPIFLTGPKVSVENALEFIRRTDKSFAGHSSFFTNDRAFKRDFTSWVYGFSDERDIPYEKLRELYDRESRFSEAFGHVPLEHLSSRFVASAYVFGPHGTVHPDGTVLANRNFGKYPSVEEVTSDIDAVARSFPWLSFRLALWDTEEDRRGAPTHFWRVHEGAWAECEPFDLAAQHAEDRAEDLEKAMRNLLSGGRSFETTWTVAALKGMWDEQVRAAQEASGILELTRKLTA